MNKTLYKVDYTEYISMTSALKCNSVESKEIKIL